MKYLISRASFVTSLINIISAATTNEPTNELQVKMEQKRPSNDNPSDTFGQNPNLKSLWTYRPLPLQPHQIDEDGLRSVELKTPLPLTRLAKPLAFGFDPYFNTEYFHPFERRQKPVTLVAFRKNGLLSRQNVEIPPARSDEVAELQSPFNDISSFWHDEPGQI